MLNHRLKKHIWDGVKLALGLALAISITLVQSKSNASIVSEVRPQAINRSKQRPCIAMATEDLIGKEPLEKATKPIAVVGIMML